VEVCRNGTLKEAALDPCPGEVKQWQDDQGSFALLVARNEARIDLEYFHGVFAFEIADFFFVYFPSNDSHNLRGQQPWPKPNHVYSASG
jgi:hypothetical protein